MPAASLQSVLVPSPVHKTSPEIRAVCFSTATIRSGRVAVATIDCSGLAPEDIHCEITSPGFVLDVLPTRTRQGRNVILGVRIHRNLGALRSLCLVRFHAGSQGARASVTVLG